MEKNNEKYDFQKIKALISVLRQYPDGIWLRRLSRESKIPLSTTHYYIENVLSSLIDNIGARDSEGNFFGIRLIKLKPGIKHQLDSGTSLQKIIKTHNIIKNSG
ncbi:MAG: hypothetical protein DRP11_02325 [Candidatus Aenigmatarchaeota archaeon]|nr:MAG: hypothetical protein DRP11_02325 [Candidatus Aenigmarchaeota archaeon]